LNFCADVAAELPERVSGDPGRLHQILINLVGNAIKFTGEGEVSLKVEAESPRYEPPTLHVTVSDTGIGIPKEKLNAVFDMFTQADSSTTRRSGGTGLGLSISKRLVELMGGTIWVESELGAGSRFHFTIRLGVAREPVGDASIVRSEILCGVKVLIVDDNRTNRRILEGLLRNWEMKSTMVADGEQALERMLAAAEAGEPFNLVLTDAHMPKMDGFELVENIQRKTGLSAATIMMLTSGGGRGDAARCGELGIAAYLTKPVRKSELHEAIARVLGGKEQPGPAPLITRYSLQGERDPARSLDILLAEDNPVNQKLATRLLEKRGHRVVVTSNGRDALSELAKRSYDLVLMDVQMPEMDGLEATMVLRNKERNTEDHQPIVAMTARAMKGDRERCLAAGMDGYLTKPVRPRELDEMLERYTSRAKDRTFRPEPLFPSKDSVNVEELMARIEGDSALLLELVKMFRESYPPLMRSVHQAIERKDSSAMEVAGHALRGSLANLGAKHASTMAGELEAIGRTGDLSGAESSATRLQDELILVAAALDSSCREASIENSRR